MKARHVFAKQDFSLKPFQPDSRGLEIRGYVARRANCLMANFEIAGNIGMIDIPGRKREPSRVKGLWANTCLELFLAVRGRDEYWEVNIAPSGDWNVFRFDCYEEERSADRLREETIIAHLPSRARERPGSFSLDFELGLEGLAGEGRVLEIGASAVITPPRTFWALLHCGPHPDFHRRDSFTIRL